MITEGLTMAVVELRKPLTVENWKAVNSIACISDPSITSRSNILWINSSCNSDRTNLIFDSMESGN